MDLPTDPSLEKLFNGHTGHITSLSFSPDTTRLVSSSTDSSLILWNVQKTRATKFEKHTDSVTGVSFASTGNMMASCSMDKSVRLWKPSIKPSCKDFRAHTSAVRSIHISPDATTLLSASNDKNIKLWLCEYHNKFLSTFSGHTNWVNCARFSHNGQVVVSCAEDKTVKLWDKHSNVCTYTFHEKIGIPKYVEFHPNDKCIGICYSNNDIKIYDTRTYKLLQIYTAHTKSVNQISFHPNGNFLISGSNDATVKVFDLKEGRVIYTLEGHKGPVTAVVFSSDGHSFASGGVDKKVLIWRTNFDKEVLAKSLETSAIAKDTDNPDNRKSRTVDARLSFSKMEDANIEEASSIQTTNCDLTSDDGKSITNEKFNSTFTSLNSEECTFHTGGGDGSTNISDQLAHVMKTLSSLKVDVEKIQTQLTNTTEAIMKLEKSWRKCKNVDNSKEE